MSWVVLGDEKIEGMLDFNINMLLWFPIVLCIFL